MAKSTRKTETQPLSAVFEAFLEAYRLKRKFKESYILTHWERIMGKTIAQRTSEIYISDGTLFLKISSSSLSHDLMLSKTRMIELLNQELGEDIIKSIVIK